MLLPVSYKRNPALVIRSAVLTITATSNGAQKLTGTSAAKPFELSGVLWRATKFKNQQDNMQLN